MILNTTHDIILPTPPSKPRLRNHPLALNPQLIHKLRILSPLLRPLIRFSKRREISAATRSCLPTRRAKQRRCRAIRYREGARYEAPINRDTG